MFLCNNYNLLVFTYITKIVLSMLMTIIPFILLEMIVIKTIKYKRHNKKFNKFFVTKTLKNIFYVFAIFILSYSIHNILNNDNNICYKYAEREIVTEYQTVYQNLQNSNMAEEEKAKQLSTTLSTAYSIYLNNGKTTLENNGEKDPITEIPVIEAVEKVKDTLNLSTTNYDKQNNIYIENGVFYYPKFVYGDKNTYSGFNCPSNPENSGYNNPYGYNNYFYSRLEALIREANDYGYKATISSQGCRSYNTQVNYYYSMTYGRAAFPGQSLHGFGIASDLEFYNPDGSVCSYNRNADTCPSMGWIHNNAERFGLSFPLLYAAYREDWHIEPINKGTY